MLHIFNVFRENKDSDNCAKMLEECIKMFGTKSLGDEHDCNVVSMNSLNTHDANDMQSHKLGDAMFDEDDIFSLPSSHVQIYYDDSMPPIYDGYIDESGFGRVSTLGSNESTILEEVSIDYDENKVATYDDHCDKTYSIKSSDKTCHDYNYPFSKHYSFNVETIYSIRVSYDTPTIPNEKNFAYVESTKISMQIYHEKNALGAGYIAEYIHDATENYYEG